MFCIVKFGVFIELIRIVFFILGGLVCLISNIIKVFFIFYLCKYIRGFGNYCLCGCCVIKDGV